ncbi:unnamed protein product [Kluyveromyces dobzhanskii CBS 2104]|uniref:DNA mismatch repair protein n=1 Tax=Kluyveromyces dobzhanskii CBS 2104 TaxID=1427455 RepID=A0A0A8L2T7_9SACH|nr:unnamed protein product [Kluyveromyces dobzhanskii CBS 2104]
MTVETPKSLKKVSSMPVSSGKKKYKQASIASFFKKREKPSESTPERPKESETTLNGSDESLLKDKVDAPQQLVFKPAAEVSETKPVEKPVEKPAEKPVETVVSLRGRRRKNVNLKESDEEELDEDDDGDVSMTKRKRIRSEIESDSEDEYRDDGEAEEAEEDDFDKGVEDTSLNSQQSEADINNDDDDDDDDILEFASKKSKSKAVVRTPARKPVVYKPQQASPGTPRSMGRHTKFNKTNGERYQWLVHERDADGRDKTDPDYDPRTLYIPRDAWFKFTPFEKQYWEIKSKMWDCILFFKKGKFFELYEKDAHLGHHLFDLKIAGGGRANMQLAGVPEMSFDYWASQFIQYGYKVAKVDQKESMLAKEMREGSKGIVERELQCVLTSGTLTDSEMLRSDLATYCVAVREEPITYYDEDISAIPKVGKFFGFAAIDTATGHIDLLEFEDDEECSQLDTIMSQFKPTEVIMEKSNVCSLAQKIIKFNAQPEALINQRTGKEFYDTEKTFDELITHEYFESMEKWPVVLKSYYETGKKVGFHAFGGLLSYLQWLKLDKSLVTMGQVEEYNPIRSQTCLALDGVTLQNLEIFANTYDGTDRGSLFRLINKAITPMGKRKLRKWIMHPLLKIDDINSRLDSVDLLLSDMNLRDLLENELLKLPDLERMLSRVHSCSLKIQHFNKVLTGFEDIQTLVEQLSTFADLKGSLKEYLSEVPTSLTTVLKSWSNAFDRNLAVTDGVIVPNRGVEPEFDESMDRIQGIEDQLQEFLTQYKRLLKSSSIQFKDSGKEIYTIEVPMSATRNVPHEWTQMAANKSYKRYYSADVQKLARQMAEAREMHKVLEDDLKNRLYKKFTNHYNSVWLPTLQAISSIDCIISLARTSEQLGFPACRPKLVEEINPVTNEKLNGFLKFKELRHPCFNMGSSSAKEFIPNDVILGKEAAQVGLLTGANAAGKSTVLRMTCVAVILAQIGCYVPCEDAEFTPVDRIMTRLGASDNIMQGKSTFFVELSETKKILDLVTNRSLLVVDELGRGGSSSDGFAIAEAVLHHVATHIQSLGFFATHYAALGSSFTNHPNVKPLKMAILVDEDSRNVTFLYKLVDGKSDGSFGMHVAAMCGIPKCVVDSAAVAAENLEHTSRLIKERRHLHQSTNPVPLGLQSDMVRLVFGDGLKNSKQGTGESVRVYDNNIKTNVLKSFISVVNGLTV